MEDLGKNLTEQMLKNNWGQRYNALIKEVLADKDVQMFIRSHDKLTKDDILKSFSKLYEFVNVKRQIAAGKEVFIPGYSPNLIISDHHIEVEYIPTKELLAKQKQIELNRRFKIISLPKNVRKANLDDYFTNNDDRRVALLKSLEFIEKYTANKNEFCKGLYLCGSFGVGKTYLLAGVANRLAQKGVQVTLIHMPSFAVEMKGSISKNSTLQKIDEIKKVPVLMMDDIGADQMSSWFRDDILGVILQYRMQEGLPTFFSSNFTMEQLQENYLTINSRGEAEPMKAMRIMERIAFLADEVNLIGENLRNSN